MTFGISPGIKVARCIVCIFRGSCQCLPPSPAQKGPGKANVGSFSSRTFGGIYVSHDSMPSARQLDAIQLAQPNIHKNKQHSCLSRGVQSDILMIDILMIDTLMIFGVDPLDPVGPWYCQASMTIVTCHYSAHYEQT